MHSTIFRSKAGFGSVSVTSPWQRAQGTWPSAWARCENRTPSGRLCSRGHAAGALASRRAVSQSSVGCSTLRLSWQPRQREMEGIPACSVRSAPVWQWVQGSSRDAVCTGWGNEGSWPQAAIGARMHRTVTQIVPNRTRGVGEQDIGAGDATPVPGRSLRAVAGPALSRI